MYCPKTNMLMMQRCSKVTHEQWFSPEVSRTILLPPLPLRRPPPKKRREKATMVLLLRMMMMKKMKMPETGFSVSCFCVCDGGEVWVEGGEEQEQGRGGQVPFDIKHEGQEKERRVKMRRIKPRKRIGERGFVQRKTFNFCWVGLKVAWSQS
jgi:hypothetical protein